jgi:hypothetical protein
MPTLALAREGRRPQHPHTKAPVAGQRSHEPTMSAVRAEQAVPCRSRYPEAAACRQREVASPRPGRLRRWAGPPKAGGRSKLRGPLQSRAATASRTNPLFWPVMPRPSGEAA